MKKNEKLDFVSKFSDEIKDKSLIILDYKGLNVADFSRLRKLVKKNGFLLKVAKNTLIKKALEKNKVSGLESFLTQQNAYVYGAGDYVMLLKDVRKFAGEVNLTKLKAGVLDKRVVSDSELVNISKLPGRQALLANLLGTMIAPISNFLYAASYPAVSLVTLLENLKKKKQ